MEMGGRTLVIRALKGRQSYPENSLGGRQSGKGVLKRHELSEKNAGKELQIDEPSLKFMAGSNER